ncbi:hypothetical protein FACS189426_22240 [Bacteroidia bacterium]|nr:hypothetical protein FACS189426_22240 [Bacteroidia bacterium]
MGGFEPNYAIKEKRFNFNNGDRTTKNYIDAITQKVDNKKIHYLYNYLTDVLIPNLKESNNSANSKDLFKKMVKTYKIKDIKNQLFDSDEFISTYSLEDEDYAVVFPILPNANIKIDSMEDYIGFFVLYFSAKTHKYIYHNVDFLHFISNKVYENILILIYSQRKQARKKLYELINYLMPKNNDYFIKAAEQIKDRIICDSVDIYFWNGEREQLILKSGNEEQTYNLAQFIIDNNDESINMEIKTFIDKNNKLLEYVDKRHVLWRCGTESDKNVKTSIIIQPITIQSKTLGFIVCKNRKKKINATNRLELSIFSSYDKEIIAISGEVMATHIRILENWSRSDRLFTTLSHELRTLPQSMINNVSTLQGIFNDGISYNHIDKHYFDLRYVDNLFNELRVSSYQLHIYSEIANQDKLTPQNVEQDILEFNNWVFMNFVIGGLKKDVYKNGLDIYFEFNPNIQEKHIMKAHPILGLAISNMLQNAIQYSYFGTVIKITCTNNYNNYIITIENIGIPITENIKNSIFEKNFRGNKASEKFWKGTGLGLFLVKNVVENCHHGVVKLLDSVKLSEKNIFGIAEFRQFLSTISNKTERLYFLNCNLPETKYQKLEYYDKKLHLNGEDSDLLYKKFEFQISHNPHLSKNEIVGDYINNMFNGFETFETIYNKKINEPIYLNRFQIRIPLI